MTIAILEVTLNSPLNLLRLFGYLSKTMIESHCKKLLKNKCTNHDKSLFFLPTMKIKKIRLFTSNVQLMLYYPRYANIPLSGCLIKNRKIL